MDSEYPQSDPMHDIAELLSAVHINSTHSRAAEERMATALENAPDYSPTLSEVLNRQKAASAGIERLEQSAFIALTPAELTKYLVDASSTIRAEDRQALQVYRDTLSRSIGQIDAITARGQAADVQSRWLIWAGVGGFLFGIAFWAIFPGAIARSLPERWHVPEWMAARTMARDEYDAGARLIAVAPINRELGHDRSAGPKSKR